MALMVPGLPLDCSPKSQEADLFKQFEELLPPEVVICHSVHIKFDPEENPGDIQEAEIDFLVIVPDVGVCAIEAKAGEVHPEPDGVHAAGMDDRYLWYYANGKLMKYKGPFNQVDRASRVLMSYLAEPRNRKHGFRDISLVGGVCFQNVSQNSVSLWNLPPDGDVRRVICRDDLKKEKLYKKIISIIEYGKGTFRRTRYEKGVKTVDDKYAPLKSDQVKDFINRIIAPYMNLLPSPNFLVDYQQNKMKRFLKEQMVVLDFLEEQNVVSIGGAAGTGKTVIALEKANRLASLDEEVLFLCYNTKLRDYLSDHYPNSHIRYESIDSLYAAYFKAFGEANYSLLVDKIEKEYKQGKFPYKHFIIDEAQDYGRKDIEASGFLLLLQSIAEEKDGCCYFFYDKYQAIQSDCQIPQIIQEADCKIALFRNCRNTKMIAETSYKVLSAKERSKRAVDGFYDGLNPEASICAPEETYAQLLRMVASYKEKGYKNIVILTAETVETSCLLPLLKSEKSEKINVGGTMYPFTTVRKFKGLEAEVIILVDVSKDVLIGNDDRFRFYVGASRAQFGLGLILNLTPDEGKAVLSQLKMMGSSNVPETMGLNGVYLALGAVTIA